MKKLNDLKLIALCLITLFASSCGSGQKAAQKNSAGYEIEEKLAQYKEQGWQVQGTSRTMRGLISSTIEALRDNPSLIEITGTANNFTVISNGKQAAAADASNQYAAAATKIIQGRIESDASLNQTLGEERDKFYAAYSSQVARLIRGELKDTYTLIRTRPDGKFDCEIHYLVDEEKAISTREAAMRQAQREIEADQEFGNKIRAFVTEKPEL